MQFKQHQTEIKDLDDSKGIVVAYANAYNYEDSDEDISSPRSFLKTVKDNRKRIRVLKDHNPTVSLGVPLEINANDPYGLNTTTKFNLKKEVSRDMYEDVKLYVENGLNAELSIGYEVMSRDKSNRKIITEYKLYEYSFLTSWAANSLSTVTDIKSIKSVYGVMEWLTKMYDRPYSDPRLIQIESLLKSLSDGEPSNIVDTSDVEPIDKEQLKNELQTIFNKY